MLRDLTGLIGDRLRAGITGAFGVPGQNENGRIVVESVLQWGCVWVTHTLNTRICISTQGCKGQDGVEVKSMIDLVLVKKEMLRFVQDVRAVRGMGRGISDHHVVLCKVRLVGTWIKRREVVDRARRIRS